MEKANVSKGHSREGGRALKLLSVRQPWAHLIVTGVKDIENRSWLTNYRGPLAIQAATHVDPAGAERLPGLAVRELPRGVIVGVVELVDCVREHTSSWADPNRYNWVLSHARVLAEPIPWRGNTRLLNLPGDVARRIDETAKPYSGDDSEFGGGAGGMYSKDR